MDNNKKTFNLCTMGSIVMALVFSAVAIVGLATGSFPLNYEVEAFTTNKIGIVVLFMAAAANLISVIVTRIVINNPKKFSLISKGTIFTSMAFIALIFVFQQSFVSITLWLLGAGISVATLSACSDIVRPATDKPKKEKSKK